MKQKSARTELTDFCVFILTNKRPDNVKTIKTFEKFGYTGDWYLVVDDKDPTIDRYIENFGKDKIKIFSKDEVYKYSDLFDNLEENEKNQATITYARSACYDIAEQIGIRYFCEFDDDYTEFQYRYPSLDGEHLRACDVDNLDDIFCALLDFLDSSDKIQTVALAQNGDFIGGVNCPRVKKQVIRKAMNSFICDTHKRIVFCGRFNEDVDTFVRYGRLGHLFFTYCGATVHQTETQQTKDGGISENYISRGTYLKSFYTVLESPSSVKVKVMMSKYWRIHHGIAEENTYPRVVSGRYKK